MKLIYTKAQSGIKIGQEVKVGDMVQTRSMGLCRVISFRRPHKPSSEGRVNLRAIGGDECEFYVSVIGAEWIEREDREPVPPKPALICWKVEEVETNIGNQVVTILLSSNDGKSVEVDVCIRGTRIVVECENLLTGKVIGYHTEENVTYHLPQ